MNLIPGQRLSSGRHALYVIGERDAKNGPSRLYAARKMFFNHRYSEREFYEAAADEAVDVLLRVCELPTPGTNSEGHRAGDDLVYEAKEVLAAHPEWFPQPLDLFEFIPEQDSGNTAVGQHKWLALAMSSPHCPSLHVWREPQTETTLLSLRVALEILDFLQQLHARKQTIGRLTAHDFVIDETGRLCCMASDRVKPHNAAHGAQEVGGPQSSAADTGHAPASPPRSYRGDLTSWAELVLLIVADVDAATPNSEGAHPGDSDRDPARQRLEAVLARLAEQDPATFRALSLGRNQRDPQLVLAGWVEGVCRCLDPDFQNRPQDVRQLREIADGQPPARSLSRLWSRMRFSRPQKQQDGTSLVPQNDPEKHG